VNVRVRVVISVLNNSTLQKLTSFLPFIQSRNFNLQSWLQRNALLLACEASALKPEVQAIIKEGGAQDFFAIENAMLAHVKF
jgi:hypothetical protein